MGFVNSKVKQSGILNTVRAAPAFNSHGFHGFSAHYEDKTTTSKVSLCSDVNGLAIKWWILYLKILCPNGIFKKVSHIHKHLQHPLYQGIQYAGNQNTFHTFWDLKKI